MEKINFYLINASIVPDIYKKVITAKSLLARGKAKSASQAAKMAEAHTINIRMQFLNITATTAATLLQSMQSLWTMRVFFQAL